MKRLTALTSVLAGFLLAGAVCPCEGQALQVRSWIEFVPFQTPVDLALWDPAEDAVTLGYQFQILLPPKNGVLMGRVPSAPTSPTRGSTGSM